MNHVELEGDLSDYPEIRQTSTGKTMATVRICTVSGNYRAYHKVTAWEELAESARALRKGSVVHVIGRLAYRTYEGKDGQKKYVTDIVAHSLEIVRSGDGERHEERDPPLPDDDIPF